MKVELGRKAVGLRFLGKVTQLGKVSVDHYNLRVEIALAVGYEDTASLQIGWIVLLVEPYTSLFTCADVFLRIQNISKVACDGTPVDQT